MDYAKWNKLFDLVLLVIAVVHILASSLIERFIPVIVPLLSLLAGYLSLINLRLPKEKKVQIRYSTSAFGIHPYVTFALLLIYDFFLLVQGRKI